MQIANGYQQDNRGKCLAIFLVTLFVVLMLFGCRTVSKTSSSEKKESVSESDSMSVKKTDSAATVKEGFDYYRETIEEDFTQGVAQPAPNTPISGGLDSENLHNTLDSSKVSSIAQPAPFSVKKRTTTREWGKYQKTSTVDLNKSDSGHQKKTSEETIIKTNRTVDRHFEWGNMLFPLMAVGICIIIVIYGFNWLKRKFPEGLDNIGK